MEKAVKTNRKTIAAFMAVILAICITFGLVMYRFITNPTIANAATTETKMKIDLYNGMDAVSRDESSLIDFTLSNIKDTLSASNQSLTPEQEEVLKQSLSEKITELISAGVLKYDENGNLTGESKSYFINEIMNTFKESCNGIDMEKEVDLGDIYTRLTNLENYVKQIDMNNQALVKTVENLTKAQVMVDGSSSNIDSEELQKTLDALKTDVEMKNYVQNNVTEQSTISGSQEKLDLSNASYEESIKQLQEAFNKMNETQAEIVNNLNTTITNLNQAVNDIATNSNDIADIKSLLTSSTEELASVKDSISQVKTELMGIIEANKAEAEASLNDLKNELNSYIDSNKTESSEELIAAKQELQEALNNASSLSEDERAKIQAAIDALDKTTQENFATTNTTIETNKEESIQQLSLTKEDLENKINEASELSLNERTAITSALTEYQEAANNEMGLLNDNLEINKAEASDNLESVKQELLQLIGDNKTEITTALNNYISQTDAAIANLNALVESNKQEAANNLKTTKEQLEEALRTSDSVNSAERKKIQTALDNYIAKTDAAIEGLKDSIKKANELIEANKNSAKIDLEAVRTELKGQMSDMKTELQNSMNTNKQEAADNLNAAKQEAANNLNTAKQELQEALNNANSNNKTERDKISAALQNYVNVSTQTFAEVNTKISDTNTALDNAVRDLNASITALQKTVADNKKISDDSDAKLSQDITNLGDGLTAKIDSNTSEITNLKQQLSYYLGSGEHIKIDSINNITINKSGSANASANVYVWKANSNGTSSVTITNDYLKGCSSVQVNYKEQYNINPTYVINDETGTLTISVLSSFVTGPVYINQVVIYHN